LKPKPNLIEEGDFNVEVVMGEGDFEQTDLQGNAKYGDLEDKSFTLILNVDTIENLTSGTCIIPSYQKGDRFVVCKEGRKVKIFKIVEEKK